VGRDPGALIETGGRGCRARSTLGADPAMLNFLARRLLGALLVLALVSILTFGIIWLIPGDPASAFLDASATPEQVERLRVQLGLDKPLPLQIVDWYGRILRGDLGRSILLDRSVTDAILERLPVTLSIAGIAFAIAVVAGIAAGTIAAVNHNRWPDQVVMATALFGLSVPDFWLGLVLVFVFAVSLGVLPSGGFVPPTESIVGWLRTIALPAATLALVQVGFIARMARASMLDVLNQDFVRTADAKGLSRSYVVFRHGLPNALVPILTVAGIVAGALLGGAVIVEQVFSIPGVGRLVIGAILARDFPVIQGGLLFLAAIYLTVNLIVDVLYAVVDPRVRLQ
jgi:peptide/nickel transport system permease protein